MKKILTALLMGLLLAPALSQAVDFTATDQVFGVAASGAQADQFMQTWADHLIQVNEEFTAATPSTGDILQWDGAKYVPTTPITLPADELVMNPIEWHFNSDQLGASATVPDEAMTYRIPYGVDYDTVWIDCDGTTHTGLAIDIAYAATRYGTYTDESTAITTVGSSVDVSGYGSLTAGQYISARVSTASTGDATMCNMQLILTTN